MAEEQLALIDSMTNVELRAELKRHGCSTSGNKKDLSAKLRVVLTKEYEQTLQENSVGHTKNEIPTASNDQLPASSPLLPMTSSISTPEPITIPITPEKRSRTRSKKPSIDSQIIETVNAATVQQPNNDEQNDVKNGTNGQTIESKPFVSKSNEEESKDIEKLGESSPSTSVGNHSSAKCESIVKEILLSDEPSRLTPSNSVELSEQKQMNDIPTVADTKNNSITSCTIDETKNPNEIIEKLSSSIASPDSKSPTKKQCENNKINKSLSIDNKLDKTNSSVQQQVQPSSSVMKGLHRSTNHRLNLSSDILKTLIPNIGLAPASVLTDELERSTNANHIEYSLDEPILDTSIDEEFLSSDSMTIGELADQKHPRSRTVVMDISTGSASLNDDLVEGKKTKIATTTRLPLFESKVLLDGKTNAIMMDEPVRIKDPSITNEPLSRIIYIRGLTRPFTLPQLKELLRRYGSVQDDQCWLDKIKSQCFVVYNTIEEAQSARQGIDGCRWPSTNPKTLSVRFARQEEFNFSKTHDLPPDQMTLDSIDRVMHDKSSHSSNEIKATKRTEMGERDIEKEAKNGFLIIEDETVNSVETPAKGLDDYFRKTTTKPTIYWLPLTEEQIIEQITRQEQRNVERAAAQKKRQTDEPVRTSKTNKDSNSHRQSSASKEKRPRSSSVSRRDTKRH